MESNIKLKWIAFSPSLSIPFYFIKKKNVIFADNVHSLGSFLKSYKISSLVGVAVNMKHRRKKNLIWSFLLRAGRANYRDHN